MTPPKPRGKQIKGLAPEAPAGEAARLALDVRLRDVERLLREASVEGAGDEKAIHRLRVSTRRGAAALRVFKAWVPKGHRKSVQGQLREVRRAAGEARMCDVQLGQFRDLMGPAPEALRPAIGIVIGRIIERRGPAGAEVRAMGADREHGVVAIGRARQALVDSIGTEKTKASREAEVGRLTLSALAAEQFPALVADMRESGAADLTVVDRVHALRIAGKRVRYAAEIFECCFEAEAHDELLRRLAEFQDRLGDMNDLWEMTERVQRYADDSSDHPEIAEALGRLRLDLSGRFDRAHRAFLEWWGGHGIDAVFGGLRLPGDGRAGDAPVVRAKRAPDRIIERTTPYTA
jgi:adenylate cyclase